MLCDDIEITNTGSRTVAINACDKGQQYFQINGDATPTHSVSGQPVDLEAAINATIEILNQSKSTLICGLDQLTTQAQQAAWKLADKIGATIDTTFSNDARSNMFALQRVGKVTATIGEIANRSDLVVFWFCDPELTHPRLLERLNTPPDHPNRRVIVVDQTETKTAKQADMYIQADRDSCPPILATLRARFAKVSVDENRVRESTGLEPGSIENLADALRQAQYGSIFYGQTTPDSSFDIATESLSQLIRQLNNETRFVAMKLRTDTNAQSAENVLSWSSGYPFAADHRLNYPRFNWLEFSAETILTRGQCDAILFAAGPGLQETFAGLSPTARDHLGSIPKIAITPFVDFQNDVAIQVGIPGLSEAGEFCRNDDISLPLGKTRLTNGISSAEVLNRLIEAC